ncbi:hypothetical protein [Cylindrospermum sp. FACHB-282]|uniref:hypothetical protein n=1 Tax=Cylindrospermum sp. FACHB-282 TaxID=2692794 RepID=UPI001683F2BE|nr:hypothetical protein [Cylindrospermum sp. FACHB-282]MBD2387079.1 hypothetical protein [Cylindrospermum sp. FACHB-282]
MKDNNSQKPTSHAQPGELSQQQPFKESVDEDHLSLAVSDENLEKVSGVGTFTR